MQRHTTDGAASRKTVKRAWFKLAAISAVAMGVTMASTPAARADQASDTIASWSADAQKAAKGMIKMHGAPDETTPTMLVWHNSGPWKRIIASKTATPHSFPAPHPDLVEQTLSYKVPENKFDELARFDGSVNVDRTRGEMSARCDAEFHNILALNLAHDIITGRRSVEDARAFYARVVKIEKMKKELHPYGLRLNFSPQANANDPDHIMPQLRPMVRQMRAMGKM